jgi:hypothetical protein
MTLGSVIVGLILLAIVVAIIISMVRARRAGKHIGCDGCGSCSQDCSSSSSSSECSCADKMVKDMEERLR